MRTKILLKHLNINYLIIFFLLVVSFTVYKPLFLFIQQPIQRFDWLTSFIDAYLGPDPCFDQISCLINTVKYQFNLENKWLYRPFAATYFHASMILNKYNFLYLLLLKIFYLLVVSYLIYNSVKKNKQNILAFIIFIGLIFSHSSQPFLFIFSTEVETICIYILSTYFLCKGINGNYKYLFLSFFFNLIYLGFKEIGTVLLLSNLIILFLYLIIYFKKIKIKKYLIIYFVLSITIFFYFYLNLITNLRFIEEMFAYQRESFLSLSRLSDNIKYILPIQRNSMIGKTFQIFFLIFLLVIIIKFMISVLRNLKKQKYVDKKLFKIIILSSAFALLFSLSIDNAYPPRTSPRYVYPIVLLLYLFLFDNIRYLIFKKNISIFIVLLIFITGSKIQENRILSFNNDNLKFINLINKGIEVKKEFPCTFILSSNIYNEVNLTLIHLYGDRFKLFKNHVIDTPQILDEKNLNFCTDLKIVSVLPIKEVLKNCLFKDYNLSSIEYLYENKYYKHLEKGSFLNDIPYFESGTLPYNYFSPFIIYSFSKQTHDKKLLFKIKKDIYLPETNNIDFEKDYILIPELNNLEDYVVKLEEINTNYKIEYFKNYEASPFNFKTHEVSIQLNKKGKENLSITLIPVKRYNEVNNYLF